MQYTSTTAVNKILSLKKRIKIIQGGSSAGKTIAVLLILIDKALSEKGKVFSVVSESMPHLKKGAMRDFLDIMEGHNYFKEDSWNRTDSIYTFETGTKIEFFGADNADKVRGPRRQVLFINEANNISYETYTQLVIRTSEDVFIDYNPVAEFWVHEEIIPNMSHDFIILTYKDNEGLPETIVQELESRREKKSWWQVYGMGQLGDGDGKIYTNWHIIDEVPHYAKLERYGLDFGYTNDPTAIVAVHYANGGYILDEITFQKGLGNKQIADILTTNDPALVIADSAEPKSIDEIASHGVNIQGVQKTKGETKSDTFVKWSIDLTKEQKISVTKRSVNILKEYRNYMWAKDKDGRITNEPEHTWSHSMDAIRYAMISIVKKPVFNMTASAPLIAYYGDRDIPF